MGDRFTPGDQVRVDTRSGESFYGAYLRWRPRAMYEHLVRLVVLRESSLGLRVNDVVPCTDTEVQACPFVAKPPTSIAGIEQFLDDG